MVFFRFWQLFFLLNLFKTYQHYILFATLSTLGWCFIALPHTHQFKVSERRLSRFRYTFGTQPKGFERSSKPYRNQVSGIGVNGFETPPLGFDTTLRVYSTGATGCSTSGVKDLTSTHGCKSLTRAIVWSALTGSMPASTWFRDASYSTQGLPHSKGVKNFRRCVRVIAFQQSKALGLKHLRRPSRASPFHAQR